MASDLAVTQHYSFGGLQERIQAALSQLSGPVTVQALGAVDEFHVGGRPATLRLIEQLALGSDDHVLDIGSGLGGMARSIASSTQARVTGIDLTEEYVQVAQWLTELVELDARVRFMHGSANELNVADVKFSAATMVHVGMNIADKAALFARLSQILSPGSTFAIYDIMAVEPGAANDLQYPVPWAGSVATSYLATPDEYATWLTQAGFAIQSINDRSQAARAALEAQPTGATSGPPPLGLHLIMGIDTPTKIANMAAAIRSEQIAPTEVIATI